MEAHQCVLWVGVFETAEVTMVGASSRELGSCGSLVFPFPCLYGHGALSSWVNHVSGLFLPSFPNEICQGPCS